MCDPEDIRNKISHVQSPQGQNVVIVPTNQENKGTKEGFLYACMIPWGVFGGVILLLGFIFWMVISSHRFKVEPIPDDASEEMIAKHRHLKSVSEDFYLASKIILAIGGSFFVPFVLLGCCIMTILKKRRDRFMYTGSGDERQPVTEEE